MTNPAPNVFTDAEAAALADKGEDLGRIAMAIQFFYAHGFNEGGWLALGCDIVTDGLTCFAGMDNPSRPAMRKSLSENLEESREMATAEYPYRWKNEEIHVAEAWLDISKYRLWIIANGARKWGLDDFEGQLLGMASGIETGSTIGSSIEERFADLTREWREELKASTEVAA